MPPDEPPKSTSSSVTIASEKARALRIERLVALLEKRLDLPIAAIDALIAEAGEGEPQVKLWERLHAAAARDKVEANVADAYLKAIESVRMRRLAPSAQADVLVHAADFFQGIRGDLDTTERLLRRALDLCPGRVDVFTRLERRFERPGEERRLVELYATVAATPPREAKVLSTQTLNRLVLLGAKQTISDDACRKLLALVPMNAKVLDALEAHCRSTKRAALAAELVERALLEDDVAPAAIVTQRRHRLLDLYFGEIATPSRAIDHVELLLERDPNDAVAFKGGERLLGKSDVASRAAATLQKARRARSG